jgi:hypothetical protein
VAVLGKELADRDIALAGGHGFGRGAAFDRRVRLIGGRRFVRDWRVRVAVGPPCVRSVRRRTIHMRGGRRLRFRPWFSEIQPGQQFSSAKSYFGAQKQFSRALPGRFVAWQVLREPPTHSRFCAAWPFKPVFYAQSVVLQCRVSPYQSGGADYNGFAWCFPGGFAGMRLTSGVTIIPLK